jgi:Mn2+/Fe2+ NRAMP family transporter
LTTLEIVIALLVFFVLLFFILAARAEVSGTIRGGVVCDGVVCWSGFSGQQRRRRRLITVLGFLTACLMVVGAFADPHESTLFFLTCWSVVIFFLLWIILLGVIDYLLVKTQFKLASASEKIEGILIDYQLKRELKGKNTTKQETKQEDEK